MIQHILFQYKNPSVYGSSFVPPYINAISVKMVTLLYTDGIIKKNVVCAQQFIRKRINSIFIHHVEKYV